VPTLRAAYQAKNAEAGIKKLVAFEVVYWGQCYPAIALNWRRNQDYVVPFFASPRACADPIHSERH
jgi:transposase-like protein